jgi:ubiquinone/menaquinone biosynthesis C-methylase UbiE
VAESRKPKTEQPGWSGWDDYAAFYDWENAQTMGRRDVRFWQGLAGRLRGPVLELGCGTGRVTLPLARGGARVVGIDRSASMLDRGLARLRRSRLTRKPALVRGDITALPFPDASFGLVAAPYGILQSLLDDEVLDATIGSAARVLRRGGTLGIDLVSDLPSWREYENRTKLTGTRGTGRNLVRITLVESVRQDPARGLTTFEQEFIERHGRETRRHRFTLSFRTVTVEEMVYRLEHAGFRVTAVLGDYDGGAWDERADVWLIVAVRL